MDTKYTITLFSVIILGAVAMLKWKQVHRSYYYFLSAMILGCVNEILSFVLVYGLHVRSTSINNNIFVLLEAILLVMFFREAPNFRKHKTLLIGLIAALSLWWIYENIFLGRLYSISFYFRIIYSFVIVLLSIGYLNNLLGRIRSHILKNPDFLICSGLIIYFTYKILVEMFWLYGLNSSPAFRNMVYSILVYINLFCNTIYTIAILWMPRKQIFTVPS